MEKIRTKKQSNHSNLHLQKRNSENNNLLYN